MTTLPPVNPEARCPKTMTFGPCGGVDRLGGCEVDRRPCPFLERQLSVVPDSTPGSLRTPMVAPPSLNQLIDLRPDWPATLDSALADRYRQYGPATAFLIGEHVDDTHGLGVAEHARQVRDRLGLPLVITITGRNRNRLQAERVLDELAEVGVAAVHCVTGDHPAARFGPRHTADFGVDSQLLVALAAERGLAVTVAESPASPPVSDRPLRVVNKQRAGAGAVVVNHAGSSQEVRGFAERCRDAGVSAQLIGPVPLIADRHSALRLSRFPGLALDAAFVTAVLDSADPVAEGQRQAVAFARRLLNVEPGEGEPLAGINLSGVGPPDPLARVDFVASILNELR